MRKQQIAIIALAAWLTLVCVFMFILQNVDIEIFFVFSSLGIFFIIELIEPRYVQNNYMRYKWYLIAAWVVIFGLIVVHKLMNILA
jgi:hypothetical protein